jgi:hypothetical protein
MLTDWSSRYANLLAWLRDLAVNEGGFELRGVRGWATAAEAEPPKRTTWIAGDLASLFRRGELIREDVRVPDATHPVWAYHILDDSISARASQGGPHVYLRPGVAVVLEGLRAAFNDSARRPRIPGEPEWRTTRELTSWTRSEATRTGRDLWFISEDIQWAVKNGLVEKRMVPPSAGAPTTQPVAIYRLTVTGGAVQPLVWRAPRAG